MRYSQQPNPEPVTDGDTGFLGVNALLDPALLGMDSALASAVSNSPDSRRVLMPGMVQDAQNCRFDDGKIACRAGTITPPDFNPSAGFGTIYGDGIFSDPNRREWLLVAVSDGVYRLGDGVAPTRKITFPAGETISGACELVQTFDTVLLFRGEDADVLEWDGTATAFTAITQTSSGTFTEAIPNADYAVVMAGRAFVPESRDQIAASDLADYTRWDSTLASFRINSGEDDSIVGLASYRRRILVVFKDQSIHMLINVEGDLSDVAVDEVSGEIGCVARKSIAGVGGDLLWLAPQGVMRFTEVVENSMVAQEVPVSEPIQPIIERINWQYASAACACVHDRFYHLAVPLDGATTNNAVLVYDTVTRQWQGYDTYATAASVAISRFRRTDYLGRRRRIALDYTAGKVYVCDFGRGEDELDGTLYDIAQSMTTRGYAAGDSGLKNWRHIAWSADTWRPSVTVTAVVEGVNETRPLRTSLTRDRSKYTVHGAGSVDITDPTELDNPHREDYAILADDAVVMDGATDLFPVREQHYEDGLPIREKSRWAAAKFENAQGTFALKSVTVNGTRKPNLGRLTS